LVSNDAQYGLKLYESLLVHEIVGNESTCYQIQSCVNGHTTPHEKKRVRQKDNRNADVVCDKMEVHVWFVSISGNINRRKRI